MGANRVQRWVASRRGSSDRAALGVHESGCCPCHECLRYTHMFALLRPLHVLRPLYICLQKWLQVNCLSSRYESIECRSVQIYGTKATVQMLLSLEQPLPGSKHAHPVPGCQWHLVCLQIWPPPHVCALQNHHRLRVWFHICVLSHVPPSSQFFAKEFC